MGVNTSASPHDDPSGQSSQSSLAGVQASRSSRFRQQVTLDLDDAEQESPSSASDLVRDGGFRGRAATRTSMSTRTSHTLSSSRCSRFSTKEVYRFDEEASDSSVARTFLRTRHSSARKTIRTLLKACVMSKSGQAFFYTGFGGRGRNAKVVGEHCHKNGDYIMVLRNADGPLGEIATGDRLRALDGAARTGQAAIKGIAAAEVRSIKGLEGYLVLDTWSEDEDSCDPMFSNEILLSSAKLWSVVLAERLVTIDLFKSNETYKLALERVLNSLEEAERSPKGNLGISENLIPGHVLRSAVNCDRVALWTYDSTSEELVHTRHGQPSGFRVSVHRSPLGELVKNGSGEVMCVPTVTSYGQEEYDDNCAMPAPNSPNGPPPSVKSVRRSGPQTALCVPIRGGHEDAHHCPSAGKSWTILQFMKSKRGPEDSFSHFDYVRAEDLQCSSLPLMLRIRDSILRISAQQVQRDQLQAALKRLHSAESVIEIAQMVQTDSFKVMGCEKCTLYFIDDAKDQIWAPPTETLPHGLCVGIGEGLVGHVVCISREDNIADDHVFTVNDPSKCPSWKGDVVDGFVTRNVMTKPIWSSGKQRRLLGVIQALNKSSSAGSSCHYVNPQDSCEHNFSTNDELTLNLLSRGVGDNLQRLIMDLMFTKARLDVEQNNGGGNLFNASGFQEFQEYYGEQQNHASAVTRGVECVAMALNVEPGPTSAFCFRSPVSASPVSPITPATESPHVPDQPPEGKQDGVFAWDLDYWALGFEDAYSLVVRMLRKTGVLPDLHVDLTALYNYMRVVRSLYHRNPYHNFEHAMMVVHYSYRFMMAMNLLDHLAKSDIFAMIIGALCHDVDHRARNNAFESMTRSELAIRYNDRSVLENHHCAQAFQIAMSKSECDIFKHLEAQTFGCIRQRMISGILSTDMKFHGDHVNIVQSFQLQPGTDQAQFLVELLLHAADISGPLMHQPISFRWLKAVHREFSMQVEDERRLGLPVSKFMDGLSDPVNAANSQLSFFKFIIHPLFDPLFLNFFGFAAPRRFLEENKKALAEVAEGQTSALD